MSLDRDKLQHLVKTRAERARANPVRLRIGTAVCDFRAARTKYQHTRFEPNVQYASCSQAVIDFFEPRAVVPAPVEVKDAPQARTLPAVIERWVRVKPRRLTRWPILWHDLRRVAQLYHLHHVV